MKQIYRFIGLLFIIILTGCQNDNSFKIDKVDVQAQVLPDGDLYVQEIFTYNVKGEMEYAERGLELLGHEGVEFFESYLPPQGKRLGEFSYENLERVNVDYSNKYSSYFSKLNAEDEVKRIYYRYRINEAAKKYQDTAELEWNFFTFNEADLHNVTIEVLFMPHSYQGKEIEMFSYNRNGGEFTEQKGYSITYKTDFISEDDTLTQYYLFPANHLSEMSVKDSSTTREERLKDAIAREENYQLRESRFELVAKVLSHVQWVLIGLVLFSLLKAHILIAKWKARSIPLSEIESWSPVFQIYVYRKGEIKLHDFLAGVFSIYQKGFLSIKKVPASYRFQKVENALKVTLLFSYTGKRRALKDADLFLLRWLFRHHPDGTQGLILDSIAEPSKKERNQKGYKRKLRRLLSEVKDWKKAIEKEFQVEFSIKKNRLLKVFSVALVIVHFILVLSMFIADAKSWLTICLSAVCFIIGAFLVWKYSLKKRAACFYFIGSFFFAAQSHDDTSIVTYFNLVILSILLIILTPRVKLSKEMIIKREAVKRWRRILKYGGIPTEKRQESFMTYVQTAIVLGVGKQFISRFKRKFPHERVDEIVLFDEEIMNMIESVIKPLKHVTEKKVSPKKRTSSSSSGDTGGGDWPFDFGGGSDGGGDGGGD
ncbi:DUF2207 domain-containing protein [Metabacillus sp. 22489]|uniref:DUF2207 domain-containing protein n=1 Tax=Metabacillus sp. 22489 TaxID=3453928 RepID=UPI003F8303EE